MKKSIKIAALMVAAVATMVACNNNTPAEEELDTIVEEATEIVVEEPTVNSEEVAVAEQAAPATEEKAVVDNSKKQIVDANKPAAAEFEGKLQEGEANSAKKQTLSKPAAANMVKNVKKAE